MRMSRQGEYRADERSDGVQPFGEFKFLFVPFSTSVDEVLPPLRSCPHRTSFVVAITASAQHFISPT